MEIRRPVFIIGAGRSGTTILYQCLSTHPEFCWFSNYSDRFIGNPLFIFMHRALDLPLVGPRIKENIINRTGPRFNIRPVEADRIYHDYCGFREDIRTTEEDHDPEAERKLRGLMSRHIQLTGKQRFLSKQISNNQRIRLISSVFPDALFVHIIRDGRAVTNSLLNVPFWDSVELWWLGGKRVSECKAEGWDPVRLCAENWKRDLEELLGNRDIFGDRYIEVRYEDFTSDPRGAINRITEFCGIGNPDSFIENIPRDLPDMNLKWKKSLTEEEKRVAAEVQRELLTRFGYEL
jgi:hypothetical protein